MMKIKTAFSLLAAVGLVFSGALLAAGGKTYEVTGTVLEATGSKVTIQKGAEKFEIDLDPATTKGTTDLKVGSTVTVTYVMSATKAQPSIASATTTTGPKLGATAAAAAAETTPAVTGARKKEEASPSPTPTQ
jgi:hypothetical protein